MKSARIVQQLTSDAARLQEYKYALQQNNNFTQSSALFRAFSSHRQPSASLNKDIFQLGNPLGRTVGKAL